MEFKVLVSDSISEEGVKKLETGADVDVLVGLSKDELIEKIGDYDALVVRSATKVTKDVIEAGKNLKVIGRAGAGVDNIDVIAATERGIVVVNAPEGNTISAAEHAIAMMMSLSRNIPQANASLKSQKWDKNKHIGVEVTDKELGVIGLGRIGSEVAKRAQGLGMKVIAYDPFISEESSKELGIELLSLDEIFTRADYITIHTPVNRETYHLIGDEEFKKMKDGVRLINCARGGIIDEDALYRAVKEGKVAGAALDVFESEPPGDNKLLELERVIVTPHLGASTKEAQLNVAITIADQILRAMRNEPVKNAINMFSVKPEVFDKLKPYLSLAEKMGSLSAQLITGHINSVDICFHGDLAEKETGIITIAMLKGMLDPILGSNINFVNAPIVAKDRGIKVIESRTDMAEDFINLITTSINTDKETKTIAGTLFGKDDPRIVKIDGYRVDAIPSGYMLIARYIDKPKVIGPVGVLLGENNINIAGMQVGRESAGGEAIMVFNIDGQVSEEVLKAVENVDGILSVKAVRLYGTLR
ncbi:MAG: phosphoglycerate dehydrogenase [Halobacteriota archaeon]|nr:phosphoglycerate dehydrogenase [Halobacteriota archaeon]